MVKANVKDTSSRRGSSTAAASPAQMTDAQLAVVQRQVDAIAELFVGTEDEQFRDVAGAARFLKLRPATMNNWRTLGYGPPYSKLGRRVVYSVAELVKWAHAQRRSSTTAPTSRSRA